MTDDDRHQQQPDDGDEALRQQLARDAVGTSDQHDSQVLLAARAAGREIRLRADDERPRGWTYWARPAAIAAAVLIGMLFVFDSALQPPPVDETTLRGVDAGDIVPPHRATVAEPPLRFVWQPQSGARSYRIVLRDAAAEPLWDSGLVGQNELELPDEVRRQLTPGQTYLWTVDIERQTASESLGPFWFRIGE